MNHSCPMVCAGLVQGGGVDAAHINTIKGEAATLAVVEPACAFGRSNGSGPTLVSYDILMCSQAAATLLHRPATNSTTLAHEQLL